MSINDSNAFQCNVTKLFFFATGKGFFIYFESSEKTFVQLSLYIQFETTNWNLWKTLFEQQEKFV